MALAGFVEFTFHLTRLNPEMINIARDCGHVTFNFFKFDLDDSKGNRPCLNDVFLIVVFRHPDTPNGDFLLNVVLENWSYN